MRKIKWISALIFAVAIGQTASFAQGCGGWYAFMQKNTEAQAAEDVFSSFKNSIPNDTQAILFGVEHSDIAAHRRLQSLIDSLRNPRKQACLMMELATDSQYIVNRLKFQKDYNRQAAFNDLIAEIRKIYGPLNTRDIEDYSHKLFPVIDLVISATKAGIEPYFFDVDREIRSKLIIKNDSRYKMRIRNEFMAEFILGKVSSKECEQTFVVVGQAHLLMNSKNAEYRSLSGLLNDKEIKSHVAIIGSDQGIYNFIGSTVAPKGCSPGKLSKSNQQTLVGPADFPGAFTSLLHNYEDKLGPFEPVLWDRSLTAFVF